MFVEGARESDEDEMDEEELVAIIEAIRSPISSDCEGDRMLCERVVLAAAPDGSMVADIGVDERGDRE